MANTWNCNCFCALMLEILRWNFPVKHCIIKLSGSEIWSDLLISARPFICHLLRKNLPTHLLRNLCHFGAELVSAFSSFILPQIGWLCLSVHLVMWCAVHLWQNVLQSKCWRKDTSSERKRRRMSKGKRRSYCGWIIRSS